MNQPKQIALPVQLPDEMSLENFVLPEDCDPEMIPGWQSSLNPVALVYGPQGSGVTHLLTGGLNPERADHQYLPLTELLSFQPEIIESIPLGGRLAMDDIQLLRSADRSWLVALVDLYHRQLESGGSLRFGSHLAPREMDISLADFQSRLLSGPVWRLPRPDEKQLRKILEFRAKARGFEMSDAVLSWLLNRESRELKNLMCLLDQLDRMTLEQRRRLTVPFLVEWFGQDSINSSEGGPQS